MNISKNYKVGMLDSEKTKLNMLINEVHKGGPAVRNVYDYVEILMSNAYNKAVHNHGEHKDRFVT